MHRHSATVCSRIPRFSPKCSQKMAVYESMQTLYQFFDIMSDVTLHMNMTPLTVEDRLLIKTLQSEKGGLVEKK